MGFEDIMNLSIKYLLIIFNILFVITGIIIISVGSTVQGRYDGYLPFLDGGFRSVPAFLIAIGIIIFIISIFGICGAIKENYYMTLIFSIMLIAIFILELAAGISGYVLRNRTESILNKNLESSIKEYYNNVTTAQTTWDDIQTTFACCGINNATDWETDKTPLSCCKIPVGAYGTFSCDIGSEALYKTPCIAGLVDFIKTHATSLGAAGICIAIAQFIGIIFACHLTKRAKNEMVFT